MNVMASICIRLSLNYHEIIIKLEFLISYCKSDQSELHQYSVHGQLQLINSTGNYRTDLKCPPFKAHHQQSWYSQLEEETPFSEAVPAPALPSLFVQTPPPHIANGNDCGDHVRNNQWDRRTTAMYTLSSSVMLYYSHSKQLNCSCKES